MNNRVADEEDDDKGRPGLTCLTPSVAAVIGVGVSRNEPAKAAARAVKGPQKRRAGKRAA